jgi:serine/threonine protein phosphatase PrpC
MSLAPLPTELRLEIAAASDIGQHRERNEDAIRVLPDHGVVILSDGMGGHQAGDVASRMAVEIIAEELISGSAGGGADAVLFSDRMVEAIKTANDAIRAVSHSDPKCHGMGATVVVAAYENRKILAAHLGDSRLYRYWNGRLQQLTEDHTLAQRYVNAGVIDPGDAKTWFGRNMLLKGLGIDKRVEPALTEVTAELGQLYLLCSDGLTDAVPDDLIAEVLGHRPLSLDEAVETLIDTANDNGGPDNISVVLIRVTED